MKLFNYDIEIISAPPILGLKPTGVESLGKSLFDSGLVEKLRCTHSVIHVPTLNNLYKDTRDHEIKCLNGEAIKEFLWF
jgi:arginase